MGILLFFASVCLESIILCLNFQSVIYSIIHKKIILNEMITNESVHARAHQWNAFSTYGYDWKSQNKTKKNETEKRLRVEKRWMKHKSNKL